MLLLLDEWVFHDLLGENGSDALRDTAKFLIAFRQSNDRMVFPSKKRWRQKAFQLMGLTDPLGRQLSQLFHGLLQDSNRAVPVETDRMPPTVQASNVQIPRKDRYLAPAYVCPDADLLVTTDQTLHRLFIQLGFNCQMRDEFLQLYLVGGLS